MKKNNSSSGFSLIEVLVVIAIIGILAAIVIPRLKEGRISASDAKTIAQVSGLRSQANLFHNDSYGAYGSTIGPAVSTALINETDPIAANLFDDAIPEDNGLYNMVSTLPSGTFFYWAWNGVLPSSGGKWFLAATTSTGSVCADYTGAIKKSSIILPPAPSILDFLGAYPLLDTVSFTCSD